MICDVCEKGEIRDYKDGTTHCNNQKCLMPYTPPVYGRGDLRKREPLTGYHKLINILRLVWTVKPALIVIMVYILGLLTVISWVWICTSFL